MVDLFQAPIPGQSLTDEPRNSPWESPPDLNTVEEATEYYIKRLSKDTVLDDLALVFQLGGTLRNVSETLATMGTMQGVHSVDVQMLVAPVIAEYMRMAMLTYGIEVEDDLVNEEELNRKREEARMDTILEAAIERSVKENGKDEGTELLSGMRDAAEEEITEAAPEMEQEETEEPMAEQPKGLMAQGQ